jgi:hypothetical protein
MWHAGSDHRGRRKGRARLGAGLALLVALLALPEEAQARRRRPFLVQGVGSGLVIRQQPTPTSPRVGEIPAAAPGLIASGRRRRAGRSVWHEVEYQGVRGWVNAPTLQAQRPPPARAAARASEEGVFMEDLVCLGRAPDWKLVIDRDGSVACTTGCAAAEELRAVPAQAEKGRKSSWRMSIRDERDNDVMLVSLRYTGQCQDAAGERYAYRVNTLSADGTRQSGCCNRTDETVTTTATP